MLSRHLALWHRSCAGSSNSWRKRCVSWRMICSENGKDGKEPGKSTAGDASTHVEDDDFGMDDFVTTVHEEDENLDVEAMLNNLQDKPDATPEIASELVARMVDATARALEKKTSVHGNVLSAFTPHTISVLRASRICTNTVHASLSSMIKYPIEKRVTAELYLDKLDLSAPAREVLLQLSGPRVRENGAWVKLSCDKFPTKEENRAYIVTKLDLLVSAAKNAVGQSVNLAPLETWDDVVREVERQATDEIEEAGSVQRVLGEV